MFGWTADRDTSFAVLDAFVDAGGTMIDTADAYTRPDPGRSETILGEWMRARGNRDTLHLATKVGAQPGRTGLSAANIAAAARESLSRLGTDRIDLYHAHRDDPDTAQEETLDAFDALVREGLVREIGASNFSAERLRSALEISGRDGLTAFTAIQPHYNLMERDDFELALAPLAESDELAVYPYYGLAKGFLTGKYRPDSPAPEGPRAEGATAYLDSRGRAVLAGLDEIAAGYGVPVPAVALAWLAAQPSVTAPIASARTPEQLAQLLPMRTLALTDDELRLMAYLSATS
ncbi:NADP-dependent aryl-alcohol dehydrogenase [Pseudonocardia saturnea]|uniref:General stress protein 69 n=2 Tax=Pseudonocardia TaxID=1847 RepID=A0A1Y2N0T9_PSEAH|nr:General stress protein 69 [Pseudonocardia autotrophica]BBG04564.1 NADP-dependent aryl-alcohol dehydrogenase [Pseudonocardia autotrophica]GEC28942.1 NADP-dependent aryl-alcohol dehydrogenase [Pseudonocardia saturnea]